MNLSDFTLFIAEFAGAVVIAFIIIYLARNAGGPRRGQRPGTDFYSGPPAADEPSFSVPNLTDVTPIHPHGEPHAHVSADAGAKAAAGRKH
jgi:hypothetical protein